MGIGVSRKSESSGDKHLISGVHNSKAAFFPQAKWARKKKKDLKDRLKSQKL